MENQQTTIKCQLKEVRDELRAVYSCFNNLIEDDLIEACIIKINALESIEQNLVLNCRR